MGGQVNSRWFHGGLSRVLYLSTLAALSALVTATPLFTDSYSTVHVVEVHVVMYRTEEGYNLIIRLHSGSDTLFTAHTFILTVNLIT